MFTIFQYFSLSNILLFNFYLYGMTNIEVFSLQNKQINCENFVFNFCCCLLAILKSIHWGSLEKRLQINRYKKQQKKKINKNIIFFLLFFIFCKQFSFFDNYFLLQMWFTKGAQFSTIQFTFSIVRIILQCISHLIYTRWIDSRKIHNRNG